MSESTVLKSTTLIQVQILEKKTYNTSNHLSTFSALVFAAFTKNEERQRQQAKRTQYCSVRLRIVYIP